MAAVCISVSPSAPGALTAAAAVGGKDHHGVRRQAGRSVMTAVSPSVSRTPVGMPSMSISSTVGRSSRGRRNSSIAARVVDFVSGDSAPPPPSPPMSGTQIYVGSLLYVGNLPRSVHSRELVEFFKDVGNLERAEVIYDKETQRSKGFAFVTMSSVEDSQRAVNRLDGSDLDGRFVKVNFPNAMDLEKGVQNVKDFVVRDSAPPAVVGVTLYVGNLPGRFYDVLLGDFFREKLGYLDLQKLMNSQVLADSDTHKSKGFGLVTMMTVEESRRAIDLLDGADLEGRVLKVEFPNLVDLELGVREIVRFEEPSLELTTYGWEVVEDPLPPPAAGTTLYAYGGNLPPRVRREINSFYYRSDVDLGNVKHVEPNRALTDKINTDEGTSHTQEAQLSPRFSLLFVFIVFILGILVGCFIQPHISFQG